MDWSWLYVQLDTLMEWCFTLFDDVDYLTGGLYTIFSWAGNLVVSIVNVVKAIGKFIWRAILALLHSPFSTIWNAIKRGYSRLMRVLQWYQKHVLKPLQDMRDQIYRIYNRFFRPVIQILESLRTMVRFLALFDKKLAALIDSKLTWLENLVMTPITSALKRINSLTSYMRAILTPLGMLDRVLLIESMRRDASIIWDTITNPRQAIHDTVEPTPARTQTDRVNDFSDFVAGRGGTYAESTDHLTLYFSDLLRGVE